MSALCPESYSAARVPGSKGWLTECPNMKPDPADRSFTSEHYVCAVCGRRESLDYDEMR